MTIDQYAACYALPDDVTKELRSVAFWDMTDNERAASISQYAVRHPLADSMFEDVTKKQQQEARSEIVDRIKYQFYKAMLDATFTIPHTANSILSQQDSGESIMKAVREVSR